VHAALFVGFPIERVRMSWADATDKEEAERLSDAETVDVTDSQDASSVSDSNDDVEVLEGTLPDGVPSVGSMNHPHLCGQPCKYIKKSRGCRDGANCSHCHICVWQSRRHGKNKVQNPKVIPSVGPLSIS
jgi:hypothetical protein